jgi:hypothetical protein
MLMLDHDQQIPHIDQSLFGVDCDVWDMPSENQVPICPGGHTSADIDVGSRRQEELPDPGIESVTVPLKKRAAGSITW